MNWNLCNFSSQPHSGSESEFEKPTFGSLTSGSFKRFRLSRDLKGNQRQNSMNKIFLIFLFWFQKKISFSLTKNRWLWFGWNVWVKIDRKNSEDGEKERQLLQILDLPRKDWGSANFEVRHCFIWFSILAHICSVRKIDRHAGEVSAHNFTNDNVAPIFDYHR